MPPNWPVGDWSNAVKQATVPPSEGVNYSSIRGQERMLGAMEDIIKLGRNYGIGVSLLSQRPQSVNIEQVADLLGAAEPVSDWYRERFSPGSDRHREPWSLGFPKKKDPCETSSSGPH